MSAPVAQQPSTDGPPQRYGQRQQRPPRSASLQKYKRVEKVREPTPDNEIRVMGSGRVPRYVTYAAKLFGEMDRSSVTIRATGKAVAIAVSVCEVIKRRFKGLHQMTCIGWTDISDEYEPLEAGLEQRVETRTVPSISILLTRNEADVDKKAPGYQAPLDESLLQENDPESLANVGLRQPRRQGRRQKPRSKDGPNATKATAGGTTDAPETKPGRPRNGRKGNKNGVTRQDETATVAPPSNVALPVKP